MKKTLLSVALLLACTSIWADSLKPVAEYTYINAGTPTENFSASTTIYANFSKISGGVLTDQLSAYGGSDITIVKFDASELPEGATVTAATLTFHSACTVSGKNSQLAVSTIGTNWTAATATWENVDLTASFVKDLAWSDANGVNQSCDVKEVIVNDEDKVIAFAIYTNTGRQQEISNIALDIEYTMEAVAEYDYTVTAVDAEGNALSTLAEGKCLATDNLVVSAPYAVEKDGNWYVINGDYAQPITESGDVKVAYTLNENIKGFVDLNNDAKGNYSGGAVGHVAGAGNLTTGASLGTVPAGVYTVTFPLQANGNRGIYVRNTKITEGDNTVVNADINRNSAAGVYTTAEFTLTEEASLIVTGYTNDTKVNQSADVDYVILTKVGDYVALNTLLSAGIYSAAGSVELVEGVTEDMIPASFKKYVGKYMSSCTLEGDENALTFSANSEDALLSAFTIKGDKIAYDETTVITLGGKEFGVQGLNGETKGTLNLVAQDGHFIYIDGFTVTYLGKPVAVVKDLGIGQGNGTEAAPYIVYDNESLPGPKASVMDPVTYQYSYTYYQYTAEKDGVLELSTSALGYVMGDINGESLGTKVVKAGDVLVIRMGAQYDLSSQAWTLNVRDLAEGETQATAIELAEGNNDVKSIQNGGLPMWYAVKVPAQKQVTVAFVDGYPGGYIVNGETETRIEYINGAYKAVYLNESDAEQTIYLRIESLYQECKAEVSYKDASEILPAITALGNPAFSIENGAELAEAPESITVTFPEIKGAVAEDDVFAAIYVFELDEDGNQTGSPINLAGYEYVGTVADGITIDNVEFEAGKSYKINVSTVGVREVADLGYRKEYAYTYPNADENPTNIQNEITFSVASGDAPIVVEGVISLFDENVTIAAGESAYLTDKINVDEEEIDAVKIGTAKKAGSIILTVPAGAEGVSFYALSWAKESGTVLTATWGEGNTQEFTLTEGGVSGNSPYTYDAEKGGDHTAHCYTVEFAEPLAEATEVTLSAPKRVVFYNYVASATGLNNATVAGAVVNGKFVKNGKLLIVKNGIMYNAAGIQVK